MKTIVTAVRDNAILLSTSLAVVLSAAGAKRAIGKKLNLVVTFLNETLDVVFILSNAFKPDKDGKVRINEEELDGIQVEIAELKKAFGNFFAVR